MNQFKNKQQQFISTLVKVIKSLKLYETPNDLFKNRNGFRSEQKADSIDDLRWREKSTGVSDFQTSGEFFDPDDSTQKSQIWKQEFYRLTFQTNSNSSLENSEIFLDHLQAEDPNNLYFRFLIEVRFQNDLANTETPVHFHHNYSKVFV